MIGDAGNLFKGTYGGGQTLTGDYTLNEQYAAPFRFADAAPFEGLTVKVSITTDQKFAAGLVGKATACRITDCVSDM